MVSKTNYASDKLLAPIRHTIDNNGVSDVLPDMIIAADGEYVEYGEYVKLLAAYKEAVKKNKEKNEFKVSGGWI